MKLMRTAHLFALSLIAAACGPVEDIDEAPPLASETFEVIDDSGDNRVTVRVTAERDVLDAFDPDHLVLTVGGGEDLADFIAPSGDLDAIAADGFGAFDGAFDGVEAGVEAGSAADIEFEADDEPDEYTPPFELEVIDTDLAPGVTTYSVFEREAPAWRAWETRYFENAHDCARVYRRSLFNSIDVSMWVKRLPDSSYSALVLGARPKYHNAVKRCVADSHRMKVAVTYRQRDDFVISFW